VHREDEDEMGIQMRNGLLRWCDAAGMGRLIPRDLRPEGVVRRTAGSMDATERNTGEISEWDGVEWNGKRESRVLWQQNDRKQSWVSLSATFRLIHTTNGIYLRDNRRAVELSAQQYNPIYAPSIHDHVKL
jgi:hypothetical protein